jgi:hypothetical protein
MSPVRLLPSGILADSSTVRTLVAAVICAQLAASAPTISVLREASRRSGLPVHRAVPTTVVARIALPHERVPALALLGLEAPPVEAGSPRAWYDVSSRRLLVRRRPAPARRLVLHELVRALVDQNYGLTRMLRLRARDHDRWLAARGVVDGTAAVASGLRAPRGAGSPSERFAQLEASVGLGPGRALVAKLRYLGGRKAVATALRSFPQTTEQLLHVDKFLERERALPVRLPPRAGALTLAASETFGELDLRDLLRAYRVPNAATVAAGWGGGRLALYRSAAGASTAALEVRWDSVADAEEWREAVPRLVAAAFGTTSTRDCPPLDRCWSGAEKVAAGVVGSRSVLTSGPDAALMGSALIG